MGMREKYGKIIVGVIFVLLFSLNYLVAFGDDTDDKFKNIVTKIEGLIYSANGKFTKEQNEAGFSLISIYASELRDFVRNYPNSVLADDAQYIISVFSAGNPLKESRELEYLLENYPDAHIEDWTSKALTAIIPKPPLDLAVRFILCFDYKQLGDTKKLKRLCEESINKYPDKAKVFEKLMSELK
jgi:hypothetical protein